METITAYKCSHCPNKIYGNKKQTKAHEKKCYHNPDTKSCATCQNFLYNHGDNVCLEGLIKGKQLSTGCEKHIVHEDYIID